MLIRCFPRDGPAWLCVCLQQKGEEEEDDASRRGKGIRRDSGNFWFCSFFFFFFFAGPSPFFRSSKMNVAISDSPEYLNDLDFFFSFPPFAHPTRLLGRV